ncbi:aldehyde dehydrogenase [Serendipita vermifera]|nr:aldehyde dehydrogenase [Serendipita vermifera]
MPTSFSYQFDTKVYKGSTSFETGLFIDGKFVDGAEGGTIDVVNPTTGKVLTAVSEGTRKDVDIAVAAAQKAFETTPGFQRGKLLIRLAELLEEHAEELAAIEALDNGKAWSTARSFDVTESAAVFRYYGGWADKNHGKTIEVNPNKFAYTMHEPIGAVGCIIPWNFPLLMLSWKLGPALATGNTVVLKPSELTPLTALRVCSLINEAGFPPGVVNIITGYGTTVGAAIAEHPQLEKVAFTGSTLVGRSIMKAAANSNLKKVTLELGGKSPNIVFNDADIDQAVKWAAFGIFFNHGQCCCAGSRVFVQSGIYDKFEAAFKAHVKTLKVGDPFEEGVFQGPQVSQIQQERIMGYIESGKKEGATVTMGGDRHGDEGFFVQPTVFTDTKPNMKIVQEEIFGPVVVLTKFEDEDDIIHKANDTMYGLAAAVFTQDISRALKVAHDLKAGTVWVNCYNQLNPQMPFGGYKASGFGRELGEYALSNYTNVKAVHININHVR